MKGPVVAAAIMMVSAAPATADDIGGSWLFETSTFEQDCLIKGTMTFRPTGLRNAYACEFESEQICGPLNGDLYIRVKQTCTAQRIGRQVAIKSAVLDVVERRPAAPPGVDPDALYLADNFIVSLSKSLLEMVGGHYDEQRKLAARFWREIDLIS
jgi:hypothetical protein